ncbi:hypothetical protein Nepgr_018501 [Nepenthes gracilis]|uniref:Uncharacterized protein n=1 Tax=Nepenthes gracilis TaxID=150966 RepID=A0AAD3STF4_NEPGR|nr:hypothetical protein Nepgr_018501 [Nepenthes gracilis]
MAHAFTSLFPFWVVRTPTASQPSAYHQLRALAVHAPLCSLAVRAPLCYLAIRSSLEPCVYLAIRAPLEPCKSIPASPLTASRFSIRGRMSKPAKWASRHFATWRLGLFAYLYNRASIACVLTGQCVDWPFAICPVNTLTEKLASKASCQPDKSAQCFPLCLLWPVKELTGLLPPLLVNSVDRQNGSKAFMHFSQHVNSVDRPSSSGFSPG